MISSRHKSSCIALLFAIFGLDLSLYAQDDVVYRRNGIIERGTIIAQDAAGIHLIRSDRRESLIPADQVDRVQVKLVPAHEQGDKLFEAKKFLAAAEQLEQALRAEKRVWLRSRIATTLVACHTATGDDIAAMEACLEAVQLSDGQIGVAAVPLQWAPDRAADPVVERAGTMLQSSNPLEQLIGASFLFGTDRAQAARDTLVKLATNRDEHVGQLARMQQWRWEVGTASAADVAGWQRQVARLPADARGGPYFVVGLAFERLGQFQDAALAYFWPALVYRIDDKLSGRAALRAGNCLEQAQQPAEARQIYSEIVGRFPGSSEGQAAQRRLDALKD